jgi:transcriptional regulator with XRE-family HTH domain
MEDEISLGEWLRREREQRRLSIRQLAARAGMSHASLSNIENGLHGVKRENAQKLAAALSEGLSDPSERERLARELLTLAGFASAPEVTYEPDIETILGHIEGYSDFGQVEREVIRDAAVQAGKTMAETLRKLNARGVIGSRFESSEIAAAEEEQALLSAENELEITPDMVRGPEE